MPSDKSFALSELIGHVADELRKAKTNAVTDDPVLQLAGCEIEVAVSISVEGGGGFKFWIVEAEGKASRATTSTVKLLFGPASTLQFVSHAEPDSAGPPAPAKKSP